LNWKGVGKTLVFPWRKVWENRGFPKSSYPLASANNKGLLEISLQEP